MIARVRRGFVVLTVLIGAVIALAGCGTTDIQQVFDSSNDHPYTPKSWRKVEAHYPAYLHGKLGVLWVVDEGDPSGLFTGHGTITHLTGTGELARLVHSLQHVVPKARITAVASDAETDAITASGDLRLATRSDGILCLAYSGHTVAGHGDQLWQGTFTIAGGRGALARLHGAGRFMVLQPNLLKNYDDFSLWGTTAFTRLSLGPAQRYTSTCTKAITRPPAPKAPSKVTASFDGFAFAPASVRTTHELPAGTAVTPAGGTVSGSSTCRAANDLFAVITYAGPRGGEFQGYLAGPISASLHTGRNVIFLEASPPDGETFLKGDVIAPGRSGVLTLETLELARGC